MCSKDNVVKANIILAGDPLQLDAVVKSKFAKILGLKTSLMQHLMDQTIYKSGDPRYIIQLIENYRNHGDILKIPNECFYSGILKAKASLGKLIFSYKIMLPECLYIKNMFPDEITVSPKSDLLLDGKSRVIFNVVKGVCEQNKSKSR